MASSATAVRSHPHEPLSLPPASIGELQLQNAVQGAGFWEAVRARYAVAGGVAYLDNASYAPPPTFVLEAQERWQHQLSANPANPMRLGELEIVRAKLADLIGASLDEITLTRSATEGLALLLHGFDWHPGDEILFDGHDDPDAQNIIEILERRHGVRGVDVGLGDEPLDDDAIIACYARRLSSNTRLLFLSHVNGWTGQRLPVRQLAEIAHANETLVALDVSQSFGALDFSVADLGADFIVAPGHRWAAAGHGTGFAYFRRDTQPAIWSTLGGGSHPQSDSPFDRSARRLDRNAGQKNIPFLLGFGAAIEWQAALGRGAIEQRLLELSTHLREGLRKLPAIRVCDVSGSPLTIVSLDAPAAATARDQLFRQENIRFGIVDNAAGREAARLRISPHINNSHNDIDRAIWALGRLLAV